MRRVRVFKWERVETGLKRVFAYEATFHTFGVEYEEFETGPGNYSTAIIEKDDGTVKNVPVEMITFIGD
jgi:hypothetical protein